MQISIVTVTWNSAKTIEETLQSLYSQSLFKKGGVEHIVIDGGSTDATLNILRQYSKNIALLVSEPDNGLYDAMNKGIALSSGSVIGILNSDDLYYDSNVLEWVLDSFKKEDVDLVYADLEYFSNFRANKIVRKYRSNQFSPARLSYGLMPAHPTVFAKKTIYERFGAFDSSFKIAGDFDWVARIFKSQQISYYYSSKILVRMRAGGISNNKIKNLNLKNMEILRACKKNNIHTNYLKICTRFFFKILDFF
jgi:glycosyltransferase involved in cell wall biosynthesis